MLARETTLNVGAYLFMFVIVAVSYNTFAQNKYEYSISDSIATFVFFGFVFACLPFAWDYAEVGVRGLGVPSTFVFFCCSSVFSGRHRESELLVDDQNHAVGVDGDGSGRGGADAYAGAQGQGSYEGQGQYEAQPMEYMKRSQSEFLHNVSNAFAVHEGTDNVSNAFAAHEKGPHFGAGGGGGLGNIYQEDEYDNGFDAREQAEMALYMRRQEAVRAQQGRM